MKRVKQVYSNIELSHVFASQKQASGRSPGGAMYFEGNTMYSYGSHYVTAVIHEQAVLLNSDGYSNSTSKQRGLVSRALSHRKRFYVPDPRNPAARENLEYLQSQLAGRLEAALTNTRFRQRLNVKYDPMKDALETVAWINKEVSLYNEYLRTFGIKERPLESVDGPTASLILEIEEDKAKRYAAWVLKAPARAVEAEKQAAAARAKWELENAAKIAKAKAALEDWKLGASVTHMPYGLDCAIRIKDAQVETSHGAKVPLNDAIALAKVILTKPVNEVNEVLKGYQIGDFVGIGFDGVNVRIGCHMIPVSEVKRVFGKEV